MADYAKLRRTMVDTQLRTFDVTDRAVLAAMEDVPRERHVPPGQEGLAYLDRNIPVPGPAGDPRVVLAPMVLARMIQALAVEPGTSVLVVADAYGYGAAVLTRLGARVTRLETADESGRYQGEASPEVRLAAAPLDGSALEGPPFDAILVNGAVAERPASLLARLTPRGRLACIMSDGRAGKAVLFVRSGEAVGYRSLFDAGAPVLAAFRPAPSFQF